MARREWGGGRSLPCCLSPGLERYRARRGRGRTRCDQDRTSVGPQEEADVELKGRSKFRLRNLRMIEARAKSRTKSREPRRQMARLCRTGRHGDLDKRGRLMEALYRRSGPFKRADEVYYNT
jgi:hypothetical protein